MIDSKIPTVCEDEEALVHSLTTPVWTIACLEIVRGRFFTSEHVGLRTISINNLVVRKSREDGQQVGRVKGTYGMRYGETFGGKMSSLARANVTVLSSVGRLHHFARDKHPSQTTAERKEDELGQ